LNELQNLQYQTAQIQEQFTTPTSTTILQESASDDAPQFAHYQQPYQDFLPLHQRQLENERILQRAQEDAYQKQQIIDQQQKSAHELHQEALKEQFKIFIPDSPEVKNIIICSQKDNKPLL
jgi:hypothetical protein